ncbi:DEAD-box ATP-dependent RNA helicase CshA [Vulcanimicrobium alpinum]|uniref:RNA helicase n=1 Tax=Vulcanimicrobium alpinum TaxID=3016050 RepID=A0AAN2CB92_UNVUL|nr:DEAD/DEAH box helicase [Vulcanimicrobium alpinum]BDE07482.1 DEAD-box ATP-dependent RNA helicase CshA [Vulcanimicrobium alpinum]
MDSGTTAEGDGFGALGIEPALVAAVNGLGYEEPTAIQRAAIPPLLAGRDVLGQAATGTGKTAAFALPLLQRVARRGGEPAGAVRALVLVPTRELAMQVAEAVHKYGRALGVAVLPIYGGQSLQQQLRALQRGVDVVVATPGRALDHVRRGTLDLRAVDVVVLDEADEMLDLGFAEDLEALFAAVPAERQTALFSATMARRILAIAQRHQRDPEHVTIVDEVQPAGEGPRVREVAYVVRRADKVAALARILDMEDPTSAIVFCRMRTEVDELTETLAARGLGAEALHGGLTQEQRDRVLRRFRDNTSDVLVATDVAARGLDIEHVSHVVNFDLPASPDAYVHRIGRTGRAGRAGVAITLVEAREHRLLRNIEQTTKRRIVTESVPTVHEMRARRLEHTRDALETTLAEGDLERFRPLVEALAAEHDVFDVAAAAVKLALDARDGAQDDEEIVHIPPPPPIPPARQAAKRRPPPPKAGVERLYVGLGRNAGIRPADLVGAITNEARIDARAIGAIEIADRFSLVEVPSDAADAIIRALRQTTIRGKPMRPRRERFG